MEVVTHSECKGLQVDIPIVSKDIIGKNQRWKCTKNLKNLHYLPRQLKRSERRSEKPEDGGSTPPLGII